MFCAPVARGRVTINSVNAPGSVSTRMVPPCCLTMMSWVIDKPSPAPSPAGLVVKNGLNIFSFTSRGMPDRCHDCEATWPENIACEPGNESGLFSRRHSIWSGMMSAHRMSRWESYLLKNLFQGSDSSIVVSRQSARAHRVLYRCHPAYDRH